MIFSFSTNGNLWMRPPGKRLALPCFSDTNGDAIFLYTPPSIVSKGVSKAQNKFHAAQMYKEKRLDPEWLCLHATSMDNPHLSQEAFDNIAKVMSKQAFRREIMAEDLEEAPGAFWTRALFEGREIRRSAPLDEFVRIVIGVEPRWVPGLLVVSAGSSSLASNRHGWGCVLEDLSAAGLKPEEWAARVCAAYDQYNADAVIAETNFGGDMVVSNVQTVYKQKGKQKEINVRAIRASRGKAGAC